MEIEEAVKKYKEGLERIENSGDLAGKASFLKEVGNSYSNSGRFEEALKQYQKCLQLRKNLGDVLGVGGALFSIATFYHTRYSDMDNALRFYKKYKENSEKLGRFTGVEYIMMRIASIYVEQGKVNKALEIYKSILETAGKRRDVDCRYALYGIGLINFIKGEFQKAIEFYEKGLQICERWENLYAKAIPLNLLGEVHIVLGNYEEALTVLEESVQLEGSLYRKAEPLTNIADVYYHQNKLTEAMATCEESLALSRQYGGRIQVGKTLHLMAKICRATALKTGSEQHYNEALSYIQEAVQIFRETGSRLLPEAEATLRELHELHGSQNAE